MRGKDIGLIVKKPISNIITAAKKAITELNSRKVIYVLMWVLLITIYLFLALKKTIYADFWPINGTFQNYNVWRRFLDGQIPFKEFAVYLGAGHLVLGSLVTFICGGSFADSLFAAEILNYLIGALAVNLLAYLITKSKYVGVILSLFLVTSNIIFQEIFKNITPTFMYTALIGSYNIGNSARFIRAGAVPLLLLCVLIYYCKLSKYFQKKGGVELYSICIISFISGAFILFSNDFGIAAYLSSSFSFFLYNLKNVKKTPTIVKNILIWILFSLIGWFIGIAIITRGHVLAYFINTLNTAGTQFWYYGTSPSKILSIFDFIFVVSTPFILSVIAVVYNIYVFFRGSKADSIRALPMVYIFMSLIISILIYAFGSGSYLPDYINFIVTVALFAYIYKYLIVPMISKNKNKTELLVFILVIVISFNAPDFVQTMRSIRNRGGTYNEAMGGYLTSNIDSIVEISEKLNGEPFFSTYASALEVVTNSFQPSGTDYIIHSLGDSARAHYLDTFRNGDFEHVIGVSHSVGAWSYWINNANWYFFREVYLDYDLVEVNGYIEHWQKTEENNVMDISVALSVERIDNNSYKITCSADETVNAIADIEVSYSSSYTRAPLLDGLFHKIVHVHDITQYSLYNVNHVNYNIPPSNEGLYLPVTIHNGIGEIMITSNPANKTTLEISDVKINQILESPYEYES